MKDLIKQKLDELLVLQVDKPENKIVVVSDKKDEKERSQETFKNKNALSAASFKWNGDIRAWTIDASKFELAKKTIEGINKSEMFVSRLEDLEEFIRNSGDFEGKNNLSNKLTQYISDLSNAVDEATMSAEIRRYLTFFSKFKGHSWNNTILIFIQRPTAKRVAGFKEWEKSFHRKVIKGAKGILIFAPVFANKNDKIVSADDSELDKEVKQGSPINFRPVYVFDIADTEPIDERGEIPESPEWFLEMEPTERTQELYDFLMEAMIDMGTNTTFNSATRGEKGSAKEDHINMVSTIKGAGELSTLVHEVAHTLMHFKATSIYYQGDDISKSIKELQAESVAYVVMKHYDLPVKHQPTYIALWRGNKDLIKNNIKAISDVAKFIIQSIDNVATAHKKLDNKSKVE